MKKNLIILTLALLIALPLFGLATADLSAPLVPEAQTNYIDADGDGLCDICGNEPGKNTQAPGFIDANVEGTCDHYGTDQQGQGRGQNAQGKGVQGNAQGSNYVDADNDGACDNFGTGASQGLGRGRNRK
jgi:hypothetical protein